MAQVSWEVVHSENYLFDSPIELPRRRVGGQHTRRVDWLGDRDNPLNGVLLTGSFRVVGLADEGFYHFYARDFGGMEGTRNSLFALQYLLAIMTWKSLIYDLFSAKK